LIGVAPALALMLGGEPIDARQGLTLGLVDHLVEPGHDLLEQACAFARRQLAHPAPALTPAPLSQGLADDFFDTHAAQLAARKPGQRAPLRVL
ncbi:3-hydroxyacyl-CoA dehydrogenase, partial [Pseudomonas sp. SIMBA_068]